MCKLHCCNLACLYTHIYTHTYQELEVGDCENPVN